MTSNRLESGTWYPKSSIFELGGAPVDDEEEVNVDVAEETNADVVLNDVVTAEELVEVAAVMLVIEVAVGRFDVGDEVNVTTIEEFPANPVIVIEVG